MRRRGVKAGCCHADDIVVTDDTDGRCPRCGAHVRSDAPWCTLCYADLRPAPASAPAAVASVPVSSVPAGADQALPFDPLTAPLALIEAGANGELLTAPEKVTGWPCTRCASVVSFDESACPACGTGFLDGASGEPDFAQRIGRRGISTGAQVMIIAGGSVALIALITALLFIAGAIF
jgi:Zn finger protein HypA/HybF involved in hydrogenase expression